MGIFASLFGRKASAQRQVRVIREDGFVDLDLPLTSLSRRASGEFDVVAQGVLDARPIGFSVVVGAHWTPRQIENTDITVYSGTATLRANADASNVFVEVLAKLYGIPARARMLPSVEAKAMGMADDPRELLSSPVKFKLFFHPDDESRYAEMFLNIDPAARVVEFREKDREYRSNVLRALTEPA